ncbi:MAG: beta-galactosidase [Chloroflexi bacterium]|nr:beta-galactosidase [Chloroflexota bacterium]
MAGKNKAVGNGRATPEVQGIFSLTHNRLPTPAAIARPNLSGVSVRGYWDRFEPEEGRFDWSLFDETLALARRHGRQAAFRVMNGMGTPEWVYAAGAAAYNPRDRGVTRLPVPWDPVFHQKWRAFIHAFGERYNGRPGVAFIAMSMPAGRWAELLFPVALPSHPEYRYERFAEAHYRVIDAYAEAFPDTPLTLALTGHEYDGALQRLDDDLTDHLIARFGPDTPWAYIQANGWSELVVMGRNATVDRTFDRCWAKPLRRGFQQIAGAAWVHRTPPDVRMGDQWLANALLLRYRGQYAEIYEEDVLSEQAQTALQQQLHDLLARRAWIDGAGLLHADGIDAVRYTVDRSDPATSPTAMVVARPRTTPGSRATADRRRLGFTAAAYVRYAALERGRVVLTGGYPVFGSTIYDPAAGTITHRGAARLRYTTDGSYPVRVRPEWALSPTAATVEGDSLATARLGVETPATLATVRLVPIVLREDGQEVTGDVYEVSLGTLGGVVGQEGLRGKTPGETASRVTGAPAAGAQWLVPPLAAVEAVPGPDPLPG